MHYDGKILSLSSPREPFMMCPSSLVAVRLDNLSGSKSTLSHKDGVHMHTVVIHLYVFVSYFN